MTESEVIDAAREAGFTLSKQEPLFREILTRFAAIIAAKQREKLEREMSDTINFWKLTRIDGVSVSMAASLYENVALVKLLDDLANAIRGQK